MSAVAKTSYQKGVDAENAAARYLSRKGFEILEQRFKTKGGEIDIIARQKNLIIFAEVKAHQDEESALYAVTPRSRRRIEEAALQYLADHEEAASCDLRFDVLVVSQKTGLNLLGASCVRHLDNAWFQGQ